MSEDDQSRRDLAFKYVMGTLSTVEAWRMTDDLEEVSKCKTFFAIDVDSVVDDLTDGVYTDTPELRATVWDAIKDVCGSWDNGDAYSYAQDEIVTHIKKHNPEALVEKVKA